MPIDHRGLESVVRRVRELNNSAAVILCGKVFPVGGSHSITSRSAIKSYKDVFHLLMQAEGAVISSCCGERSALSILLGNSYKYTELMIAMMDLWIGDARRAGHRLSKFGQSTVVTGISEMVVDCFITLVSVLASLSVGATSIALKQCKSSLHLAENISLIYQSNNNSQQQLIIDQLISLSSQAASNCDRSRGERPPSRWVYSLTSMRTGLFTAFTDFVSFESSTAEKITREQPKEVTRIPKEVSGTSPALLRLLRVRQYPQVRRVTDPFMNQTAAITSMSSPEERCQTWNVLLSRSSGTTFAAMGSALKDVGWDVVQCLPSSKTKSDTSLVQKFNLLLLDKGPAEALISDYRGVSRTAAAATTAAQIDRHSSTIVNYYRGSKELTLKLKMAKLLRNANKGKSTSSFKVKSDRWLPSTYGLRPGGHQTDERCYLCNAMDGQSLWIAKPSSGSKGESILITSDFFEVTTIIDSQLTPYPWIVQKYIEQPLLLDGRKFDIRSWVLISPDRSIYVARNGVLRTASTRYTKDNYDDDLAHLTNHSVQQNGPEFGSHVEGNEMWYSEFRNYLTETTDSKISFDKHIVPQMDTITAQSLIVTYPYLQVPSNGLQSFQLLGFDFLIDDQFNVWLLEVNGSPMIAEALRTDMVTDLLEIILPKESPRPKRENDRPNQFQCIYSPHDNYSK